MDTSRLAFPKPEPRIISKKRQKLNAAMQERLCRVAVRVRDKGKCVVPGCKERAQHLHHIVYRSHSSKRKWDSGNCCSLCIGHHQLVHASKITISGDANDHLTIKGKREYLAFRL
jgi:hypothetical protein